MEGSGTIRVDGRSAYLATPVVTGRSPGPWPGVVIVHDAFGTSDDMREQADWLAAAGYVAVIPDLYAGKFPLRCVKTMIAQLSAQQGPAFDQIEGVRSWLSASADCTGMVGVMGYCMGGAFALLLAGRPGWSASSVNYGFLPSNPREVLAGACPVVASFGGKDRSLPGAAETLRRAADEAGVTADIKEYPHVGHSFINRLTAASPLTPVLKVMGVGHDHSAAADAKRRILAFFDTHLTAEPPREQPPSPQG